MTFWQPPGKLYFAAVTGTTESKLQDENGAFIPVYLHSYMVMVFSAAADLQVTDGAANVLETFQNALTEAEALGKWRLFPPGYQLDKAGFKHSAITQVTKVAYYRTGLPR